MHNRHSSSSKQGSKFNLLVQGFLARNDLQVGQQMSSKRSTSLPSQNPVSRSPMLTSNQPPRNAPAFHQQHFFGHPKAQPVIDQPQWHAAAPGLDLAFGPNAFQASVWTSCRVEHVCACAGAALWLSDLCAGRSTY